MVKVREDLTGRVFGRLKVIKQVEDYIDPKSGIHHARWLCECNCKDQTKKNVLGRDLKRNSIRSCGCLQRELLSQRNKKYNDFKLNLEDEYGLYGIGYCINTNNEFYFDMDDYDKIKDYCWQESVDKNNYHYVSTTDSGTGGIIRIQWLIAEKYYDHKDRNPLNNRKYNLRPCTISENNQNRSIGKNNTSGIIGVYWNKKGNKWCSFIMCNNKRFHLGSFDNKYDAIRTRLIAEQEYFGEFAPQKHLFEKYGITY